MSETDADQATRELDDLNVPAGIEVDGDTQRNYSPAKGFDFLNIYKLVDEDLDVEDDHVGEDMLQC